MPTLPYSVCSKLVFVIVDGNETALVSCSNYVPTQEREYIGIEQTGLLNTIPAPEN